MLSKRAAARPLRVFCDYAPPLFFEPIRSRGAARPKTSGGTGVESRNRNGAAMRAAQEVRAGGQGPLIYNHSGQWTNLQHVVIWSPCGRPRLHTAHEGLMPDPSEATQG